MLTLTNHSRRDIAALILSTSLAFGLSLVPFTAAEAAKATTKADFAVVDQNGHALSPAVVMACPVESGVVECAHLLTGNTNSAGRAKITLDAATTYDIVSFVADPDPTWACPGFIIEGHEFYFSQNRFTGAAAALPKPATLVINQPSPFDCVTVDIVDEDGNSLPNAGVIICPAAPDAVPCPNPEFDGRDPDGVIRLDVDADATYDITAFAANTGWPCPFILDNGDTLHFSPVMTIPGADLAGTEFVIHQPTADECRS